MLTASIVLAWVQQQSLGLGWTGDDIRTIGIGVIIALLGYLASTARDVRDDVRMLKRDLRGEGPVEGLIDGAFWNEYYSETAAAFLSPTGTVQVGLQADSVGTTASPVDFEFFRGIGSATPTTGGTRTITGS
jgi:hypothetical protein